MKYYKSYILKDENLIDKIPESFCYKVYYSSDFNCNIAERLNNGISDWIIYYLDCPNNKILEFHTSSKCSIRRFSFFVQLDGNNFKLINYYDSKLISYLINNFDEFGKPKLRQEFNGKFELVEYVKCIYDEQNNLIQEKNFYADSWTIHTEKMI